jgi:hypothetical protein
MVDGVCAVSGPKFFDHRGRGFALEGGMGSVRLRDTKARVWIWVFNKRKQRLFSHSIRLDLHTAREFHVELGHAIKAAEDQLISWDTNFPSEAQLAVREWEDRS